MSRKPQYEDISGNEMPAEKWYSLQESAQILGMAEDEIFRRMVTPGGDDFIIFPSVVFHKPVKMKRISDGEILFNRGLFEIDGAYQRHLWDSAEHFLLTFGGKSRVLLHQFGESYLVISQRRIRKTELVVTADEIERYAAQIGLEIELPEQEPLSVKKMYNLPDRKGQQVPVTKRRKKAEFTQVIDSLFNQLMADDAIEILRPGQSVAFLKCLSSRVKAEARMEDGRRTYGELIKTVKPNSPGESVLLQNPRTVRGVTAKEYKWYCRTDINRRLSELRSAHPQIFRKIPPK